MEPLPALLLARLLQQLRHLDAGFAGKSVELKKETSSRFLHEQSKYERRSRSYLLCSCKNRELVSFFSLLCEEVNVESYGTVTFFEKINRTIIRSKAKERSLSAHQLQDIADDCFANRQCVLNIAICRSAIVNNDQACFATLQSRIAVNGSLNVVNDWG